MSAQPPLPKNGQVADATPRNWVDRWAPKSTRPYLRLARADRPIGSWLLFWPSAWAIAFAATQYRHLPVTPTWPWLGMEAYPLPDLWLLCLFLVGSFVMRGAGCTVNDIADRNFDAQVERSRSRPLPSGQVSVTQAFIFLGLQCLVGLVILLNLNTYSIWLGAASLLPIAIYPFMKRITNWPQAVLGLTFNWGALLGWTAVTGSLTLPPLILYLGAIFWTIGYDTIYAHQDKTDDAALGLKSSALKLGEKTKPALIVFYSITSLSLLTTGYLVGMGGFYYLTITFAIWHLFRQIWRTDIHNPTRCLSVFRSNRDFGALVFAAILAGSLGSSPF